LINAKLRRMQEYLAEIEGILAMSVEDILASLEKTRTVERNFQLVVEAMLDINVHLIRECNFNAPDNLGSTFIILAENKVLEMDFARKISPIVGLRNALVHGYEKIDGERFVTFFQKDRADFDVYMHAVNDFVSKQLQ
jgi:uncharacterized protein YutE (UPF0331/DUF86 family)